MHLFARDEAGNSARGDFDYTDLPETVQEEPHPARRQVPRPRRPGDPRRDDRSQAGRRRACEVPGDQRRAAPEERRKDRLDGEGERAGDATGAASCSTRSRNNAVESAFADQRTYVYKGKDVDQQTHLGFDLASLHRRAHRRREPRQGGLRRRARDLRQLRHPRSRHGRPVALRTSLVDRRQGRRHGREGDRSSARAA